MSAAKGTMLFRMQEQSIIQRRHSEQCVLLNNVFEKLKTYLHWLWDNKSRGHTRALFQRKNSKSGVITQNLPISVFVKSACRIDFVFTEGGSALKMTHN